MASPFEISAVGKISCFSRHDAGSLLLGTEDGLVVIYSLAQQRTVYALPVSNRPVTQVSSQVDLLLVAGMEPRVQLINLAMAPLQPQPILTSLCYWPLAQWSLPGGVVACDAENGCRAVPLLDNDNDDNGDYGGYSRGLASSSSSSFPAATHQSCITQLACSSLHNVLATGDAQGHVHLIILDWPGERIISERRIWRLSLEQVVLGESFPNQQAQTILPPASQRVVSLAWSARPQTPGLLAMAVGPLVMLGAMDHHLIALELADHERSSRPSSTIAPSASSHAASSPLPSSSPSPSPSPSSPQRRPRGRPPKRK